MDRVIEPRPDDFVEPAAERARIVLCRACQHVLTTPKQAIEMLGRHEHTFRNPGGYSFHVACYSDAPGCAFIGDPTLDATWFPGYAWSLALCAKCQQHVGWRFGGSGSPPRFFGLIATRLFRAGPC